MLKIMDQKVRIVIAEDHTILREGLRSLLSSNSSFEIVGEAKDGREAIWCVEKLKPDLILMDLSIPPLLSRKMASPYLLLKLVPGMINYYLKGGG